MVLKKLRVLRGYYVSAHKMRTDFFNWKWRLFIILIAALALLFINDYLQYKYTSAIVQEIQPDGTLAAADYALSGKLFNWFMTGVLFGIIALAALYEGEFILGLRKMAKSLEKIEK